MLCDKGGTSFTILSYADSTGCLSCKLQLPRWKELVKYFDSISSHRITYLFVFHPKDQERLIKLLRKIQFDCFVYIDKNDTINQMNNFLNDDNFQTFLLDENNRVLAIGNPTYHPKIKNLYTSIIVGNDMVKNEVDQYTTATIDKTSINLGHFDWQQEQITECTMINTGNVPLTIMDVFR